MSEAFKTDVLDALARGAAMTETIEILRKHRDLGLSQQAAYDALEELRSGADEQTTDSILEIMDIVSGFCAPRHRVWGIE